MGVISDSFRARLEEMKARHAESDRRVEQMIQSTSELIAKIEAQRLAWEEEEIM